jgi:hypothetical protein
MIVYEKRDIGLKPRPITWEGIVINRGDNVFLKISPGTINNILPSNWDSELSVTGEEIKYICLRVFAQAAGQNVRITGSEFVVKNSAPTSETPTVNLPPPVFEVLIGLYNKGVYRSIFNKPLFAYPSVFMTAPKQNPENFSYPFDKYFVWEVIS